MSIRCAKSWRTQLHEGSARVARGFRPGIRGSDFDLAGVLGRKLTDCGPAEANWIARKPGVTDDKMADSALEQACLAMVGDHSNHRVTFYCLVAKELGKLASV